MNTIFLLGMPGGGELIVIAVIILLLNKNVKPYNKQ